MNTKMPISYKPSIDRGELLSLITVKLHYKAVNRFIDEAVKEKLNRELKVTSDPEMTRLIGKLTEVVYEYKGWKFLKPSKEIRARIRKKAEQIESGKVKTIRWKGSFDKTFGENPQEEVEIRKGVADMRSGKGKTVTSQELIKHLKKL
jgi:hypothetical protein